MIFAVFLAYLLMLAGIGVYCSRYNRDLSDFVIGGRRLGAWVAAFSAQASDFSGWLLIGLPAAAYAGGMSLVWTAIGCSLGVMFNWLVLARRLRSLSVRYGAITIPDFLEARFADRTRLIRVLSVAIILLFYATYVSAQFIAAGKVFQTTFLDVGMPWGEPGGFGYYHQGLLIGAAIILLYTAVGGFMAVCWTDFVQAILMVTAAFVVPLVGIYELGGFGALWERMQAGALGADMLSVTGGQAGASFVFGVLIAGLAWGLGYPGQPHIITRFMAMRSERDIAKSALISMVWSIAALWGSMFIGFVALALLGPDLPDTDRAMPRLVLSLAHFPALFQGLVLSGAIAAMMSTVDSQIIVAVSAVVRDGYEKLLGGHPSDRHAVWLSRLVVVALGTAALIMAWSGQSVFAQVLDAWTGLAAGLGPAVVLGCLWRRTTAPAVIVGMVTGVALVLAWTPLIEALGSLGGAWSAVADHLGSIKLAVCVLLNVAITMLISLVTRPAAHAGT